MMALSVASLSAARTAPSERNERAAVRSNEDNPGIAEESDRFGEAAKRHWTPDGGYYSRKALTALRARAVGMRTVDIEPSSVTLRCPPAR